MDMKEFRLGNLCRDKKTGTLLRVCELNEENDGVGFFVIDRDKYPLPDGWHAEPAPLNEEWLERLGFVDITDGYRATGQADPVFRIASPVRGQNIDLYRKWDNEAWKPKGYFLGHFEYVMQYVHQLQNLYFALTGEELTIKETV